MATIIDNHPDGLDDDYICPECGEDLEDGYCYYCDPDSVEDEEEERQS